MLLVYAKTRTGIAKKMKQLLNGRSTPAVLECYSDMNNLLQRLQRPPLNLKIGVLSIGSDAELDRLVSMKELLADMRLVLVLPDNRSRTLSKAHALAPRFITFDGAGMAALVSVVEKMMRSPIRGMSP